VGFGVNGFGSAGVRSTSRCCCSTGAGRGTIRTGGVEIITDGNFRGVVGAVGVGTTVGVGVGLGFGVGPTGRGVVVAGLIRGGAGVGTGLGAGGTSGASMTRGASATGGRFVVIA